MIDVSISDISPDDPVSPFTLESLMHILLSEFPKSLAGRDAEQ